VHIVWTRMFESEYGNSKMWKPTPISFSQIACRIASYKNRSRNLQYTAPLHGEVFLKVRRSTKVTIYEIVVFWIAAFGIVTASYYCLFWCHWWLGFVFLACAANCLSCNTHGAGKCDIGFCAVGYVLDNTTYTCSRQFLVCIFNDHRCWNVNPGCN